MSKFRGAVHYDPLVHDRDQIDQMTPEERRAAVRELHRLVQSERCYTCDRALFPREDGWEPTSCTDCQRMMRWDREEDARLIAEKAAQLEGAAPADRPGLEKELAALRREAQLYASIPSDREVSAPIGPCPHEFTDIAYQPVGDGWHLCPNCGAPQFSGIRAITRQVPASTLAPTDRMFLEMFGAVGETFAESETVEVPWTPCPVEHAERDEDGNWIIQLAA